MRDSVGEKGEAREGAGECEERRGSTGGREGHGSRGKNRKKNVRDRRRTTHLEFEGLSSRAHLRSWEGAAAAAAAAAAALAAACCEELLLPPPLVTVDQPPPPPPPTLLELSPTSADDAAAAATAADVNEEASLLSPPAVDGDAPVPVPGAALPPPADQAELTKPEELLSDAEGFCDVLMGEGKRERERGLEAKNPTTKTVMTRHQRTLPDRFPLSIRRHPCLRPHGGDQETVRKTRATEGGGSGAFSARKRV